MPDGSCSPTNRRPGPRRSCALLGLAIAVVSAPLLAADVQLVSGRALEGSVDLALCPDGSFLVSWASNPPFFVGFQHFDAEGAALSPAVPFGDITTWGTETRIGCDANNEALALWTRFGNDYAGVTSGMYVTAFSSSGSRLWPTIDLGNAVVPGAVLFLGVDMTASPAGGWIVHWSASINGSQTLREFSRRILTASGPVGEALRMDGPAARFESGLCSEQCDPGLRKARSGTEPTVRAASAPRRLSGGSGARGLRAESAGWLGLL